MALQESKKSIISNLARSIGLGKIKDKEKLDLAKNLILLLNSGIPVNEGLKIIVNQTNPGPYRNFLNKAQKKVETGSPLYGVFKENINFDQIFVNFVKAGEETGNLTQNLQFLSEWLEKSIILKKEIGSATLYPKIIITFAVILGLGLSIFVLPQIVNVLTGLQVTLPPTTRALLYVSNLMQDYGILIALGLAVLVIFVKLLLMVKFIKKMVEILMIRMPIVGPFFRSYQLAVIAQLASTLFRSGIPSNQILKIIGDSIPSYYYRDSILKIREKVEKGTNFSKAIKEYPRLYAPVFISVVSVGEETGTFDESFAYLADFFSSEIFRKIKTLPTIIEPLLLIVIGIFVVFIASAIILPVYEVTTGLY